MNKEQIINNIFNNYFYGLDFERGTINSFKRFDNNKKDILNAYNESERLDTFALIKSLYIEYFIFKCDLFDTRSYEDISTLYNDFRRRIGIVLAIFTNDLLKKIGRSMNIENASKLFEVFDSVGDALIYIYKLCQDEFKEVSKESNFIDEKELMKRALHEYVKFAEENFERGSKEYIIAFEQYKRMFSLMNNLTLKKFIDIFKPAYSELLKEVQEKNNGNVK